MSRLNKMLIILLIVGALLYGCEGKPQRDLCRILNECNFKNMNATSRGSGAVLFHFFLNNNCDKPINLLLTKQNDVVSVKSGEQWIALSESKILDSIGVSSTLLALQYQTMIDGGFDEVRTPCNGLSTVVRDGDFRYRRFGFDLGDTLGLKKLCDAWWQEEN